MSKLANIDDIIHIDFPVNDSEDASLYVYEQVSAVPFDIKRVFFIDAKNACTRGYHAHFNCNQLLVCMRGEVKLKVDDGENKIVIPMNSPYKGVLVKAGLWAEQEYSSGSLIMVIADQEYDESDYIRDYNNFIKYRNKGL